VDDHLVPSGYNAVLTEAMRSHLKNPNFQFENDVLALRADNQTEQTIENHSDEHVEQSSSNRNV
jgi:hypothetical protein